MAFTKHTQAEQAEVVSPQEHEKIEAGLKKVGKKSLEECSTEEKNAIYFDRV